MKWEQAGFAVISVAATEAGGIPVLHSFCLPEWEAQQELQKAGNLPDHLKHKLQIIPATLVFDLPE